MGVTAGFVGRLVDRVGRRQVILVTGGVTSFMLCAEAVGILSDAAVWLLVVLAALQGATIPPISASMRSLWSQLVPEETLESAFAFDAIQLELVFVIGPLIAAGLATALSPAVGMFLCAGFYLIAAMGFATAPAARSVAQEADGSGRARARSARPAYERSCSRGRLPRSPSGRSRWRSPHSRRRRARAARSAR